MTRAGRDAHIIFFEEPVFRQAEHPILELTPRRGGVLVAVPVLPEAMRVANQAAAQRALLRELLSRMSNEFGSMELLFWYYTPMALAFSEECACDLCIYDCMDELSAFRGAPPDLIERERQLFARADLVFTGGSSLYQAKRGRHAEVHLFPSSIDAGHFEQARDYSAADPVDQLHIPHPRIGYFGVIDERMDLSLVSAVAELQPSWHFVMIGPVVKIDARALPQRPNIHWLGPKPYQDLPSYLAGWDLGFMPFALNEATRFISPTKTPEFLSAGLRVLSTPITDVVHPYGEAGLVSIVSSPDEMVSSAAELFRITDRRRWLGSADAFLSGMSWDVTWSGMQELIDHLMAKTRQGAEVCVA